ncbi:hypothetical protein H8E88_13620 [candidate division KSB1 bacterium]|nr:hypothetical protein [candidate division KSB1 bacterium]
MNNKKRNYQIIATLGPLTKNKIDELIDAGATGFRLNCSHLSLQELSRWLLKLEKAFTKLGDSLPVWLDLQGAKLRIGKLSKNILLNRGDVVQFKNNYRQRSEVIPLPHQSVFEKMHNGDEILLDDGKIKLQATEIKKNEFFAEVTIPGELSSFKGFIIKNNEPPINEVANRDRSFIEQTLDLGFVGYAISYLQTADELQLFKNLAIGKQFTAKIEREQAFNQLKQFGDAADVSWLCRGDLGASAQIYDLYQFEKDFADQMAPISKPYLIAGQVLENMVVHNAPSRSEIAHLGFLFENGYSGVVLSDETAIGEFPVETVAFCREYFEYLFD